MPHILSQTDGVLAFDECATPRGEENLAMVSGIIKNCGSSMGADPIVYETEIFAIL